MIRRLAHEPLGWRPTVLEVVVCRYRCADCGHVWRQDTSAAAEPRAKLSRTGLRWAPEGIVVAHLTVARVAEGLGVAWGIANNAVLAEGKRLLINNLTRFEGVKVIGVDEHVWRHTRRGDTYVTVIIDLTPVRDGAGSNSRFTGTVGSGTTRSTSRGARCTPARTCSPTSRATGYARCSLMTLTSRWKLDEFAFAYQVEGPGAISASEAVPLRDGETRARTNLGALVNKELIGRGVWRVWRWRRI